MKYENLQQVNSICDQIKKHQANLDLLNEPTEVLITNKNGGRIYTIGTDRSSEHEYYKIGSNLVEDVKIDLRDRINTLKTALEKL